MLSDASIIGALGRDDAFSRARLDTRSRRDAVCSCKARVEFNGALG
jgi:hypothetical protein